MKKIEKKYLKTLFLLNNILLVFYIICMIYCVELIFDEQNINKYFFELVYAAFHLIVLCFFDILIILGIKEGSFFMKGLMTQGGYGKVANRSGQVVALVFSILGLFASIYFGLVFFGIDLPYFNFPIILIMLIINVALFLLVYGLYFFLYPIIVLNMKAKEKKYEKDF